MQATGIVRKIDDLGRIVLPKELRKYLNIGSGDDFQIFIDDEKIILEKYSKLKSYENSIINMIDCFSSVISEKLFLVVNNKIVNYNYEMVDNNVIDIINNRKVYINDVYTKNILTKNFIIEGKLIIHPIVIDSDLLGAIIVVGSDVNSMLNISKILFNLIKYNQSV